MLCHFVACAVNSTMHFDELYEFTGQIGVYQVCVLIILFAFDLFALDSTTMIFVAADMPHWCRIEPLAGLPFEQQKYIGIPYSEGPTGQEEDQIYSSCRMFALNYSAFSDEELSNWNRTLAINDSTPTIECTQWTYDQTTFVSTIVSEVRLKTAPQSLCKTAVWHHSLLQYNYA
jgi:hypothetical protein